MATLTPQETAFLNARPLAHLATADATGKPHVVPVCFAYDGARIYIAIDEKPKRGSPDQLKRVRNTQENPRVALVADRYDNDWTHLGWVLVQGTAALLTQGLRHRQAIALLRERYPQYRQMALEERPVIAITPEHVVSWGNLEP